jgi:histidyl-tRNA synthetase
VRRVIRRKFQQYGYEMVQPPLLEDPAPFVERSGEEIKQRMYSFHDPSGREVCIRPELTIPACRLYLNKLHGATDCHRLCYDGAVLRYDPVSFGRFREFHQVGVEQLGGADSAAADGELIALAYEAVKACGLDDVRLVMNDVQIIAAMVDQMQLEPALRERLWQRLHSSASVEAIIDDMAGPRAADGDAPLSAMLAEVGPQTLQQLVVSVLSLTHAQPPPARSMDDVAERLVRRIQQSSRRQLSRASVERLAAVRAIQGPVAEVLSQLRQLAGAEGPPSLAALIEKFQRRVSVAVACGVPPAQLKLDLGLRRSLQYYTGFIFELHVPELRGSSEVCGGGRYDQLLHSMGAAEEIPAAGFAIGADRIQLALSQLQVPDPGANVQVLVVPAGSVDLVECFRIARRFRDAGWSAEVELRGRRPRSAIAYAERKQIRYVAFAGEAELAGGNCNVRDLTQHQERTVSIAALAAYVQERRDA